MQSELSGEFQYQTSITSQKIHTLSKLQVCKS